MPFKETAYIASRVVTAIAKLCGNILQRHEHVGKMVSEIRCWNGLSSRGLSS